MIMLGWLLLGLMAGFLAGRALGTGGFGLTGDVVVGILGAFLGGFLFGVLTGNPNPLDDFAIGSLFVALIVACVLIALLRAITGDRASV